MMRVCSVLLQISRIASMLVGWPPSMSLGLLSPFFGEKKRISTSRLSTHHLHAPCWSIPHVHTPYLSTHDVHTKGLPIHQNCTHHVHEDTCTHTTLTDTPCTHTMFASTWPE